MVAKGVKRATAPTLTHRQREGESKTTEQKNPEQVGRVNELRAVRDRGKGSAGKGPGL